MPQYFRFVGLSWKSFENVRNISNTHFLFCIMYKFHNSYFVMFVTLGIFILYYFLYVVCFVYFVWTFLCHLLCEQPQAVGQLGSILLLLEERLPGLARERALVHGPNRTGTYIYCIYVGTTNVWEYSWGVV